MEVESKAVTEALNYNDPSALKAALIELMASWGKYSIGSQQRFLDWLSLWSRHTCPTSGCLATCNKLCAKYCRVFNQFSYDYRDLSDALKMVSRRYEGLLCKAGTEDEKLESAVTQRGAMWLFV